MRTFAHVALAAFLPAIAVATAVQAATTKGFSTVYDFCSQANCADGQDPIGGVVVDANGDLYGATQYGGTGSGCSDSGYYGCGTVYEITPDGTETVLYSFCSQSSCSDGGVPEAGLVMDGSGNLYGTTTYGGIFGGGNVFQIAPNGTETVLYSFPYRTNGGGVPSGLVLDPTGQVVYGALRSYQGDGGLFEALTTGAGGGFFYNFCQLGCTATGSEPAGGLMLDAAGNVYGTTYSGGANSAGVVFKVNPRSGAETVLYSFCGQANCTDGYQSLASSAAIGSLIEDEYGNLYGVTNAGGANGYGTAFELPAKGKIKQTVLHSFCSELQEGHCLDGAYPQAGLLEQGTGRLFYGTATQGGEGEYQNGVVFSLSGTTEKPIYFFGQFADGFASTPYAGLLMYNGFLYGTAESGGWKGGGIVFKVGTAGAPVARH